MAIVDDVAGTPITKKVTVTSLMDIFNSDFLSRQAIINGNFDVWQRGTSFTASGYTTDRFKLAITGSSCTTTRQSFTVGQTDVPNEPTYYVRNVVSSSAGAGNLALLEHRIEDVRTFAGQTATLSFWAKADSEKDIAVEMKQGFGSGGSSSVQVDVQKKTLTSSWAKYTITVDVDSISGKTVGANNYINVVFWFDAGSSFDSSTDTLGQQSGTFEISQVQLCSGEVALPFMPKSFEEELRACLRYYQKSYEYGIATGTATTTGSVDFNWAATTSVVALTHILQTPMRVIPDVTLWDNAGNINKVYKGAANIAAVVNQETTKSFKVYCSDATSAPQFLFHFEADAEL